MLLRFRRGIHEEEEIMKLMRLAMCVAVFALVGGIALSEDMDVRALQAKLAAQEARLNDLQAKMYSTGGSSDNVADGITSLRKNAVVTLGGTVNTRYFYRQGKIKADAGMFPDAANGPTLDGDTANGQMRKIADSKHGDLRIADAKLDVKIDVNENFDAFLKLDFQDGYGRRDVSGIAQNYWIRWKNVCNTGFGLLVGRDDLKFGGVQPYGILDSWNKDQGGSYNDVLESPMAYAAGLNFDPDEGAINTGEGMFTSGSALPTHTVWSFSRTTQITPYWENCDGSLKAEVSFIQSVDTMNGMTSSRVHSRGTPGAESMRKSRSQNYGVGSMTGRITWKPIEGLKLVASVMNLKNSGQTYRYNYPRGFGAGKADDYETASNNFATNIGFEYRPCFFNRMNVWATWTHGWNAGWVEDMDDDSVNAGVAFDLTDQLTFFVQGDYLRVKNDNATTFHKATGWSAYTGLQYRLPYGVNMEAGWRHDRIDYKTRGGQKHEKFTGDTIYAHLGFDF